jgi:hypothetical protein
MGYAASVEQIFSPFSAARDSPGRAPAFLACGSAGLFISQLSPDSDFLQEIVGPDAHPGEVIQESCLKPLG